MSDKIKKQKAHRLARDLWKWLYENPDKGKEDSPYFEEVSELFGRCPLCELYKIGRDIFGSIELKCEKCILRKELGRASEEGCVCCAEFYRWAENRSKIPVRKKNAKKIYDTIENEYKRLYGKKR